MNQQQGFAPLESVGGGARVSAPPRLAPLLPEGARGAGRVFDQQRGLGDDACSVAGENEYNEDIWEYSILNTQGAGRQALIDFTSDQTNLRFRDGVGGTPAPEVIDTSTALRQFESWHSRGRQQLLNRPYLANADVFRGNPDLIDDDTRVTYGADSTISRSAALAEVEIDRFDPAVPLDLQREEHIVSNWWVRGGENTREAARTLARVGDPPR